MGKSFNLEKGASAKSQARSGGVFLALIGVVVSILIYLPAGLIMIVLGFIFFAASFAASE